MKNNPKLLVLIGAIAVVLIVGFLWSHGDSSGHKKIIGQKEQHEAFDVASGDTNNEVLKSIVARQKTLQVENKRLIAQNKSLQAKNRKHAEQALQQAEKELKEQIHQSKALLEHQFSKEITEAKNKISKSNSHQSGKLEYQVSTSENSNISNQDNVITDAPDLSSEFNDNKNSQNLERATPKNLASSDTGPILPSDSSSGRKEKSLIAYYTIPALSTASNAVLLSPLIGEVPVGGRLTAPAFPFKAMLSPHDAENMFTANGVALPPGISGIILQGYSVGSMSLGCARAYVTRVLFVFQGGHFVVFPNNSNEDSATEVYPKNSIGYLSDSYNNACMKGRYLTDAPKVIGSLAAFGAASGVGGAIAQAQTQTISSISQGTSGSIFTGNLGKYAAGTAIGAASKAALNWYKARINNIFDAVFIPSTSGGKPRKLIFNVTKTIPIDLNKKGRKLNYESSTEMSSNDDAFD